MRAMTKSNVLLIKCSCSAKPNFTVLSCIVIVKYDSNMKNSQNDDKEMNPKDVGNKMVT